MSDTPAVSSVAAGRLRHIDGLRGVAAGLVVVFHAIEFSPAREELLRSIGPVASHWPQLGAVAVDVFFLLSGYVLLRSLTGGRTSARSFMLRRQLRLDPPYWVALVVTLAIAFGEKLVPGLSSGSFSPLDIALNFTYLQGIFGRPSILSVSWTLCLEVQLYLALLAIVVVARRFFPGPHFVPAMLALTGVAGIALNQLHPGDQRFIWEAWPLFCIGALAYAGRDHRVWTQASLGLLGLESLALFGDQPDVIVPIAVALLALQVGRRSRDF